MTHVDEITALCVGDRHCLVCGGLVEPIHLVLVRVPDGTVFVMHRGCCLHSKAAQATPALYACLLATCGALALLFDADGEFHVLAETVVLQ